MTVRLHRPDWRITELDHYEVRVDIQPEVVFVGIYDDGSGMDGGPLFYLEKHAAKALAKALLSAVDLVKDIPSSKLKID